MDTQTANTAVDTAIEEEEKVEYLQLIYISAASVDFTTEDLTNLLKKAREKNAKVDVSGMLIYHEKSFFQVLEGPEEEVYRVYDMIADDPRHDEVRLLLKSVVENRSFENWSMGFVNTDRELFEQIPGFADFFKPGFAVKEMRTEGSTLGRVMSEFREGKWRQTIS
ncbi:MAG: BLUF domain-containing protein [Bacteroidota bacterium]